MNTLHRLVSRLMSWYRASAPEERYLAAATDHADLELRIRVLDHASLGPAFVTFNH
jgi:hypothetical protein